MGKPSYTTTQIDEALALAWQYRSPTKAAKELGLQPRTVNYWVNDAYPARYHEIGNALQASITPQLVDRFHANVRKAVDVVDTALDKCGDALEAGNAQEAYDYSKVVKDCAITFSIAFDTARKLQADEPEPAPADNRTLEEHIEDLLALVGITLEPAQPAPKPIDSTATETTSLILQNPE